MLLEVRIGGGGKGAQTIFPGSIHKDTGEAIVWEDGHNGEPARVEGNVLLRTVKITATACLIARYWPAIGARHDTGLAVGGFLARSGLDVPTIELFAEAVARAAQADVGHTKRQMRDGALAPEKGAHLYGLPQLIATFGAFFRDLIAECCD